jgi:hypothetical protein
MNNYGFCWATSPSYIRNGLHCVKPAPSGENRLHFKYENDFMFNIPGADGGDRYRTAAQQLGYGKFKIGVTMFTGDPDAKYGDVKRPSTKIEGRETYYAMNGSNPDKYRAGIGYIGFGDFKIGINSESVRHIFQNRLAHDLMNVPWFHQIPDKHPSTFHFSFGANPYTLY